MKEIYNKKFALVASAEKDLPVSLLKKFTGIMN